MSIDGSGASRAGGDGTHNEDVCRVDDGLGLYVVCDGASDSAAGEVAAQIASRTPFTRSELHLGMDLQLDVFVWRETAGERAERY